MSHEIDKHHRLDEEPFSYRASKDGNKLFIFWNNRQVMILKETQATRTLTQLEGLETKAAQLLLAKLTGNFKHGNEREGKLKGKR